MNANNGGLFGYLGANINWSNKFGEIRNLGVSGTVSGGANRGGIVARINFGTVENCYSNCSVTGSTNGTGGVAGYSGSDGSVIGCYNMGSVTGSGNVGGIVGQGYGVIENCYNMGNVKGTGSNIGGIVGNGSTITNCYSTGSVTGGTSVGGAVGKTSGTVIACYYLSDGSMTDSYAVALTADQMKLQSSYEGFDFETVWGIDEGINNGFPYLRSFVATEPVGEMTAQVTSEPVYDSESGSYKINVSADNGTSAAVTTNVFVATYDEDGRMTGVYMQALTGLEPGAAFDIPAEITAEQTAFEIKIICMGEDMIPDMSESVSYTLNGSSMQ